MGAIKKMIRELEVIGPFRGASGYDRHTREFVRQFVRMGLRVQLTNLPDWSIDLPDESRETWFDGLTGEVCADAVLHFTMPPHARRRRGRPNFNYTMFEADGIPAAWVALAASHDRIVVPTESSRRAWVKSGAPEDRVAVCPLGVSGELFSEKIEPAPLALPDGRPVSSFGRRFLNIADLRPRKNHLGLIRAWLRATDPKDDAILILKLSTCQSGLLRQFQQDLIEMLNTHGLSLHHGAPICFIHGFLSDGQMRMLYQTATHYISMSKGEGWDLVMMEAAAAGLRLIAPKHSAYITYVKEEDFEIIPAKKVPAIFEGRMAREDFVFFEGLSWWEPDVTAAAGIIRKIVRAQAPGKPPPRDRILKEYTWEAAAKRLIEIMGDEPLNR